MTSFNIAWISIFAKQKIDYLKNEIFDNFFEMSVRFGIDNWIYDESYKPGLRLFLDGKTFYMFTLVIFNSIANSLDSAFSEMNRAFWKFNFLLYL